MAVICEVEVAAHGMAHAQRGEIHNHGTPVAHATIYAGNWVRCMRLPMLVLVSK
jgi:hypothetical protein